MSESQKKFDDAAQKEDDNDKDMEQQERGDMPGEDEDERPEVDPGSDDPIPMVLLRKVEN